MRVSGAVCAVRSLCGGDPRGVSRGASRDARLLCPFNDRGLLYVPDVLHDVGRGRDPGDGADHGGLPCGGGREGRSGVLRRRGSAEELLPSVVFIHARSSWREPDELPDQPDVVGPVAGEETPLR